MGYVCMSSMTFSFRLVAKQPVPVGRVHFGKGWMVAEAFSGNWRIQLNRKQQTGIALT